MEVIEMKKTRRKRKSPNGEGSINQNKRGYWRVRLSEGYDDNGKIRFKYFYAKSQKELLKKRDEYKEKKKNGICVEFTGITIGEWLEYWYNNYIVGKVGVKTRCDYESSIRCHIKPKLGRMKLTDMKGFHIQQFYNQLLEKGSLRKKGKGLSPKTVRNIHVALHRALEQAVNNDLILKNPARGVNLPPLDKNTRVALTEEEQKNLMEKCFDDPWGMAIFLDLFSGMRLGEVLGLTWADVDFKNNCISINKQVGRIQNFDENIKSKTVLCSRNKTKTLSSTRTIAIALQVMTKLSEYKINQDKHKKKWKEAYNDLNLVFCREDGNYIDQTTFRKFYIATLKKAGIAQKTFHELRHTFATRAVESNSNVKAVSSILGHANITTTLNIYTHDSQKLQQETMQNIAEKFLQVQC